MAKNNEIAIAQFVKMGFDSVYPESKSNVGLAKSKWSWGGNRWKDYCLPEHCFGFFDWFCNNFSLRGKARRLYRIVRMIEKFNRVGKKFDSSKCYVFFKNNCPCYGDYRNYDDIRICDIESGRVLFNVCPRDPFGNVVLSFQGHGFDEDTEGIEFDNIRELEKWFAS